MVNLNVGLEKNGHIMPQPPGHRKGMSKYEEHVSIDVLWPGINLASPFDTFATNPRRRISRSVIKGD